MIHIFLKFGSKLVKKAAGNTQLTRQLKLCWAQAVPTHLTKY